MISRPIQEKNRPSSLSIITMNTLTLGRLAALLGGISVIVGLAAGRSALNNGGSCAEAGMCCQGRNLTCRVFEQVAKSDSSKQGHKKKHVAVDGGDLRVCFCDAVCAELGDCCKDYKEACKPVDCAISEDWGSWGNCDARCGLGIKQRTRAVHVEPLNGGRECPPTNERIPCEGTSCKVARAPEGYEELRETGKIISASYGNWRSSAKYNPYKDIRRNLFDQYQRKSLVDRPAYCMEFEVTEVWPACEAPNSLDNSTVHLVKGNTVCVECQTLAMKKHLGSRCKGHGVYLKETRWKAVLTSGCHGKWVLKTRAEDCQCNAEAEQGFILL